MTVCPSCSKELPGEFPFCPFCGATLANPPAAATREERKFVTTLFCDLVAFTASSERADPEDVDRMLSAYFAVARAQIEGHGGTVEKFIGDAVVGVFGVPAAHEDDPERAVRAGLRIVEEADQLQGVTGAPVRLRVGINTGEALVRLGVAPASGEGFLTGDAVNTAARIQSVAPEMGVAVGLATYEMTAPVFEYEELPAAVVKGKAEPVRVFHAKASRARFGTDLLRTTNSPFIGREIDLAILKGIFDKTVAATAVQLVTVVGEPGLGKSRLVAELSAYVDARPGLVTWRQGRCLPYGEGITFWALGEILKAHTGILDSDPPRVASEKLDNVLPEGSEKEWFQQRLSPLLGIEAASSADRGELFAAWRRFLEQVAEERPTVLVFEDLHWADDAMLAFLEHLADQAEGVPLLVIGTARPELYERHSDYATRLRNATPINLAPLSQEETGRLVSALLDATVLPPELRWQVLDRAGGNPLYAEEFVRLLNDRDLLIPNGSTWELREGATVPFPESVQALIAARLDTLEPEAKSLLADAAVIGKVFWAGAVCAMGGRDPQAVTAMLRELSRKELVRPARRSSMQGEAEYAFWHILACDVAYAQLPRPSRTARHIAAAAWIESKALDRPEDLADVLAYHYATALDLARAAGLSQQAIELEGPALRFLTLAGERALGLNTAAALSSFERALALTPAGNPSRAGALTRFGEAAFQAGRTAEAAEALTEAIASFREQGSVAAAAQAMGTLAKVLYRGGDPRAFSLPAEAVALLEPLAPDRELVTALSEMTVVEVLQGRLEAGIGHAERTLSLCAELGLPPSARALGYKGLGRCHLGDAGGLEDMREAITIAAGTGLGALAAGLHQNLAIALWTYEGPAESLRVSREAISFAEARGLTDAVSALVSNRLDPLIDIGELDEALAVADGRTDNPATMFQLETRVAEARIFSLRGQATRVTSALDWLESTSRGGGAADYVVFGLGTTAFARAALGQQDAAAALLTEIEAAPGARETLNYTVYLPTLVRTALSVGDQELAERFAAGFEPRTPYAEHALTTADAALAEGRGEHATAADSYGAAARGWLQFGVVPEQAFALLGQGRCLTASGRPAEAIPALQAAREILRTLKAAPALAEADTLLEQAAPTA